jgi:O-antigen ligase
MQKRSWAVRCGLFLVWVYFIRVTGFSGYLHIPEAGWILLSFLALLSGTGLAISGEGEWRWPWLLALGCFGLGTFVAVEPGPAGLRWFGLVLLIMAVGPTAANPQVAEFRSGAWQLVTRGLPILTVSFLLWYMLHLPNMGGRVYFSAFMTQSMLLGPLCGMGIVVATARALHQKSWRWGAVALAGMIPLMASGSRLATLSTLAAGCFFLIKRKPVLGIGGALLVALAVVKFLHSAETDAERDQTVNFTTALAHKGTGNSRSELWQSRIDDFKSSPFVGVGIGLGAGNGVTKNAGGSIRIEPGSSYLAVLSMTGIFGALSFTGALGALLFRFAMVRSPQSLEKDILSVMGVFLAVHGVAEGWILGFGSPLCLIFWLWLGKVGDMVWQSDRRSYSV